MLDQDTPRFQPPYMSWATFEGILDQFARTGIPDQVDRSVLASRSGGDQSQFLRAASSFGLIDGEGVPTDRMRVLVGDPSRRGELLKDMLGESYPGVVALGTGATQQQLEEQFRQFGIEGETVRKAIAFYINAAKQTDIPLSPHFRSTRPGAGGRRSARRASRKPVENSAPILPPRPEQRLPEIIAAIVAKLPDKGETWTAEEFRWWLDMIKLAGPQEYGFQLPPEG